MMGGAGGGAPYRFGSRVRGVPGGSTPRAAPQAMRCHQDVVAEGTGYRPHNP